MSNPSEELGPFRKKLADLEQQESDLGKLKISSAHGAN